jgi:hypothetical protein
MKCAGSLSILILVQKCSSPKTLVRFTLVMAGLHEQLESLEEVQKLPDESQKKFEFDFQEKLASSERNFAKAWIDVVGYNLDRTPPWHNEPYLRQVDLYRILNN